MSSPFNPLANLTPAQTTPAVGTSNTPNPAPTAPTASLTPSLPLLTASPSLPLLAASPGLGALAGLPGLSSLPGLSNVGPKSPPAPYSTSNLQGGTPWASISAAASAGAGTLSAPAPIQLPPGWVAFGASSAGVNEADADNARRALSDVSRLLERAEVLRAEMGTLERGVFSGAGGVEALPGLQLEYAQTLLALISLSSAYLVGALPVPLSSAAGFVPPVHEDEEPAPAPGAPATTTTQTAPTSTAPASAAPTAPAAPVPATGTPGTGTTPATATAGAAATTVSSLAIATASLPTTTELAGWTEGRAQAQFARREAVRGASRAVLDVLKGR